MEKVDVATLLADDIERAERKNPGNFYAEKIDTIRRLQALGVADTDIEHLLGFPLRPQERQNATPI